MTGYNISFKNIKILLPTQTITNYSLDFSTKAISIYKAAANFTSRINNDGPKSLLYSCNAETIINGEKIVFINLGIKGNHYKYDKIEMPFIIQELFDKEYVYENSSNKIVIKNKQNELLSLIKSNELSMLEFIDVYLKLFDEQSKKEGPIYEYKALFGNIIKNVIRTQESKEYIEDRVIFLDGFIYPKHISQESVYDKILNMRKPNMYDLYEYDIIPMEDNEIIIKRGFMPTEELEEMIK